MISKTNAFYKTLPKSSTSTTLTRIWPLQHKDDQERELSNGCYMFDFLQPHQHGAFQTPLSVGFPRQECLSDLPFPTPGGLPDLGT